MSRLRSRAGLVDAIEERLEPSAAPISEVEDPRARRIDDDPALPPSKMNRADGQDAVLERAYLVELEVPLVERLERFCDPAANAFGPPEGLTLKFGCLGDDLDVRIGLLLAGLEVTVVPAREHPPDDLLVVGHRCKYACPVEPVNLYSDTQTRPTAEMRRAMAEAEVGDEQRFLDPTVNELQERVAALLGHEAALFLPSGTMCNLIGFRLHLGPAGDEVILHRTSHPVNYEAGSPGAISHAMTRQLDGEGGMFTPEEVEAAVRAPDDRYGPRSRLVSVEQTTNVGGGRIWPLEQVRGVLEVARRHGLRAHLDGARLMNAVVAGGVPAADWASGFDTAWVDFTKGLGAPVGAVLCGSRELMDEAWRWKQMLGGSLRQAGVLAAACIYALDHHVERLAEDHENARLLADGLAELGLDVEPVETNIVMVRIAEAPAMLDRLMDAGVQLTAPGPDRIRCATHLDVDRDGIERALAAFAQVLR